MCNIGFGIMAHRVDSRSKDDEIGVTTSMMWHDFPLLITDDQAQLLDYFEVYSKQLPPWVLLVYK